MSRINIGWIAGLVVVGAVGCATVPAPQELVDARVAYSRASRGPAVQYSPVTLHAAGLALQQAEQSYHDQPSSMRTRDLSYIAERRAELAEVAGQTELDTRSSQRTEAQRQTLLEQLHAAQRDQLAQTQTALTAEEQARQNAEAQAMNEAQARQQAQQQAAVAQNEYQQEHIARQNAEQTARAALASLQQIANVREEQRGLVITLNGSVLFTTGQATLLPIAQQRLDEVARALADMGDRQVVVEGHTDNRGSASVNQSLSQSRAETVRDYLAGHGVAADRLRAVGYGPSRPVADNHTAEGRANNRRVEIVVLSPGVRNPIAANP